MSGTTTKIPSHTPPLFFIVVRLHFVLGNGDGRNKHFFEHGVPHLQTLPSPLCALAANLSIRMKYRAVMSKRDV